MTFGTSRAMSAQPDHGQSGYGRTDLAAWD
jgi:hypothetical protein